MSYNLSPKVVNKVSAELDRIMHIGDHNGIVVFSSKTPMTLVYNLRQAIKSAKKFEIKPYNELFSKVRIRIIGITVVVEEIARVITEKQVKIVTINPVSFSDLVGRFIVLKGQYTRIIVDSAINEEEKSRLEKLIFSAGFSITNLDPLTLDKND